MGGGPSKADQARNEANDRIRRKIEDDYSAKRIDTRTRDQALADLQKYPGRNPTYSLSVSADPNYGKEWLAIPEEERKKTAKAGGDAFISALRGVAIENVAKEALENAGKVYDVLSFAPGTLGKAAQVASLAAETALAFAPDEEQQQDNVLRAVQAATGRLPQSSTATLGLQPVATFQAPPPLLPITQPTFAQQMYINPYPPPPEEEYDEEEEWDPYEATFGEMEQDEYDPNATLFYDPRFGYYFQ